MAVGLVAAATFALSLPRTAAGPVRWGMVAALAVAGLVALRFPLHVSLSNKVSVASAVFFAAALLMPAWQAAALVGFVSLVYTLATAARRVVASRERPPLRPVAAMIGFNPGQGYLSVLAAGLVLSSAGVSAAGGVNTVAQVGAMTLAAAVMFVMNMLLVSTAVALATARNPWTVFTATHKVVFAEFATLYVLGAAAAYAAVHVPWLLGLAVLPAVLVYRSLQYRIGLRRESVLAMERMAEEVDARDPYTYQHSRRVADYARMIARRLGLSAAEVELVELAAKVHDVGKIRIPDSVLLKPDRLTADERRIMETHPRLGHDILKQFAEYASVLELVLTHHERYDGLGYPNGVVARRLLLMAQVIPVADSFDAMTSQRAYRGARTWEEALDELRRGSGSQWNPKVVAAAVETLRLHRREANVVPVAGRQEAEQPQGLVPDAVPG